MARAKQRLDAVLVERGFFERREEALRACLAGEVRSGTVVLAQAGMQVRPDIDLQVARPRRFVSRGGHKLDGALAAFEFDVSGLSCIDVGASTGGFTDCLLQNGARSVTAVDVGYGQLAWSLRTDERVKVFDRTNIRHADPAALGAPFDLAVADLSFIGLSAVLTDISKLLTDEGSLIGLVKPQFESLRGSPTHDGVVRDETVHRACVERVIEASQDAGIPAQALCASPLPGQEGNIEFFLLMQKGGAVARLDVEAVVHTANMTLGGS